MSHEFLPPTRELKEFSSINDSIDRKRDPKEAARQHIYDFLELTSETILYGSLQSLPSLNEIVRYGESTPRELKPNQRLALYMLELEQAATTLRQLDPPRETGEVLESTWGHIDNETGAFTSMKFYSGKLGSDFGTYLNCHLNYDQEDHARDGSFVYAVLPARHYLIEVLRMGAPHEPVFEASEPDTVSDQWSEEREEWLDNGGKAVREFDSERAWYGAKSETGARPKDVFNPNKIVYLPLYDRVNAKGAERYIEIVQDLLKMLLRSVDERDAL